MFRRITWNNLLLIYFGTYLSGSLAQTLGFDDFKNFLNLILIIINFSSLYFYNRSSISQRGILGFYICYYFLMLFYGIFSGNYVSYILLDVVNFSSLFLLLRPIKMSVDNDIFSLSNHLNSVTFFAPLVALYIWYIQGFNFASSLDSRFGVDSDFELYLVPNILTLSVFLGLLYFYRTRRHFIFSLSLAFLFIFGLATLTRGIILFSFISLVFFLIIKGLKSIYIFLLIGFFGFLVFYLFSSSVFLILERSVGSNDLMNGRDEEAELLLGSMSNLDFIFGRGLGGVNKTWIWSNLDNGINLVHIQYFHLILKGGVVLSVFFYLVFLYSFLKLLASKIATNSKMLICYFLISGLFLSIGHTQLYNFPIIFFYYYFTRYSIQKVK